MEMFVLPLAKDGEQEVSIKKLDVILLTSHFTTADCKQPCSLWTSSQRARTNCLIVDAVLP